MTVRLSITLPNYLKEKVDRYQKEKQLMTRAEAFEELLSVGLEVHYNKKQ